MVLNSNGVKKALNIIYNLTWGTLLVFLAFIGATFFPIPGNYKAFTVQSGSMEPRIKLGSLIFVKPAQDYNPGDIVTFKVQGGNTTVTHRVIEKNETTFTTKGDANEESDTQTVEKSALVGKVFLTLPLVGFPIGYAKTKVGFILLIIIPSTIIIYEELREMAGEIRKKFLARRKPKANEAVLEDDIPLVKPEENIRIHDYNVGLQRNEHYVRPSLAASPPKRKIV